MMPLLAGLIAAQLEGRALVMPVRTDPAASSDVIAVARSVDTLLAQGLTRHAAFGVLTHTEVTALLEKTARAELQGCDSESCLTEIADTLGVELLVTTTLDVHEGIWILRTALVRRADAAVVRRAAVKARAVDNLMASIDELARQIGGSVSHRQEDPLLGERAQTDAAGLHLLRSTLQERGSQDVAATWTDLVIEHNRESDWLALLEGGSFLVGGVGIAVCMAVWSVGWMPYALARDRGQVSPFGLVLAGAAALPLLAVAAGAAGVGIAAAAVDALDLGRIRVGKGGCCRDEERVRNAREPGPLRRMAPYLAAAGAALSAISPAIFFFLTLGLKQALMNVPTPMSSVNVDQDQAMAIHDLGNVILNAAQFVVVGAFAGVALTFALGLMRNERSALVDDDPPPR